MKDRRSGGRNCPDVKEDMWLERYSGKVELAESVLQVYCTVDLFAVDLLCDCVACKLGSSASASLLCRYHLDPRMLGTLVPPLKTPTVVVLSTGPTSSDPKDTR